MIRALRDILLTIPGPTPAWAAIVGHLAWPAVAVFVILRFRTYIRLFLNTISERLQTDHFKLGLFEMTPNSQVIALDPARAGSGGSDYDPEDVKRIEELLEFIGEEANLHRLAVWVNENVESALEIADFVTSPEYAIERQSAYQALIARGR